MTPAKWQGLGIDWEYAPDGTAGPPRAPARVCTGAAAGSSAHLLNQRQVRRFVGFGWASAFTSLLAGLSTGCSSRSVTLKAGRTLKS